MKASDSNKAPKAKSIAVYKSMKDFSKDPFFVKKTAEANAFIRKHGLPKDLFKK